MKAEILIGRAQDQLQNIADNSVRVCVTSPPYWGLRDYGMADQLGLEQNPHEYIDALVEVFTQVRRVLTDDGTLWLNLGDSYAGSGKGGGGTYAETRRGWQNIPATRGTNLKPKDLVGIPWRAAFALQAAGWWLRQDVIWNKPNVMPESTRDRCTRSHEYLFMLTKAAKYFYDQDAIREPVAESSIKRAEYGLRTDRPSAKTSDGGIDTGKMGERFVPANGRNKRSVWTIPPARFAGAHFAVMPEALVEPCVLAGSQPGDTVLDPFAGSGTVGVVALRHGRNFIGTELNPDYAELCRDRIANLDPLLHVVEVIS